MTEPMYRRIAQDLREQIESGTVEPGNQLPTELELRDRYGASRNTVRDAVKLLTRNGLVETKPGQGTFAVRKLEPLVSALSADPQTWLDGGTGDGMFAAARQRGRTPSASVPKVEVQSADSALAAQLRIAVGTPVVWRGQDRYLDRMPWGRQATVFPMELVLQGARDLLLAQEIPGGTVAYLREQLGISEVGYQQEITVRRPDDDEARFFGLPSDGHVSVVSLARTSYQAGTKGPVPFQVVLTVLPADRNQLVISAGEVPRVPVEA
jgi:GntR family transcriptional regulator